MTVEIDEQNEAHGHEHKDVSGGWLRPAVFGAMDGLVTNVSLIAGVGAGVGASGGSPHFIVLTGLAGLAAGAFSMATGEYVSVSSQNELIGAEVRKEAHELKHNAGLRADGAGGQLPPPGGGARTWPTEVARADLGPPRAGPGRARPRGTGRGPPTTCPRRTPRPARRWSRSRSAR